MGQAIIQAGGRRVFYLDRGLSNGMAYALEHAARNGEDVTLRWLD
jgi:hypothetical protein